MLDAQAGIQYEGQAPPQQTEDDAQAIHVWNLLSDGRGGLDWAGLPYAVALHGVSDVAGLLHRLTVIKLHRPPQQRDTPPAGGNTLAG